MVTLEQKEQLRDIQRELNKAGETSAMMRLCIKVKRLPTPDEEDEHLLGIAYEIAAETEAALKKLKDWIAEAEKSKWKGK